MDEQRDVSIVIPTRRIGPTLERTLDALARQELDGIRAEVVIVENAPGTRQLASASALNEPWDIVVVDEPVPGAGAARNTGIATARGAIVLFLGDDCRPEAAGFVAGHLHAHRTHDRDVAVVGDIKWDTETEVTPVMDWLDRTGKIIDRDLLSSDQPGPLAFYTGNVSVDRRALLECGGFDERFGGYGWEDVDVAFRLADRGIHVVHDPRLVVLHQHRYTLADSLRRMEAVGVSGRLLNRLHAPPPAPRPAGARAVLARVAAPIVTRWEAADRLPRRLRDRWFRAAHFAALAKGYAAPPLPMEVSARGGWDARGVAGERPAVSVVVPFFGGRAEADDLVAALSLLDLAPGDEIAIADNTPGGVMSAASADSQIRVVRAQDEHSSYHARNVGAQAAVNSWILFLDADCRPTASLIDRYFASPISDDVGAVAGAVVGAPEQQSAVARYSRSRRLLDQQNHANHPHRPFAVTANLLVRRAALESVGGFHEGIRSGGDADMSWRLQEQGWRLEYRDLAAVRHLHRERVVPLLRQMARYGAGRRWVNARHPASHPRPRVMRRLARSVAGVVWFTATAAYERAAFKGIDAGVVVSETIGYFLGNRPASAPAPSVDQRRIAVLETFPSESGNGAAPAPGTVVEARRRPANPAPLDGDGIVVRYLEDDSVLRRTCDIAWLFRHRPLGVLRATTHARSKGDRVWPVWVLAPAARRAAGEGLQIDATFQGTSPENARRLARLASLQPPHGA